MKKKALILLLFFLIVFGVLFLFSSYRFLPWLKYRSVSQWSPEITHYRSEIKTGTDSAYYLIVSFSTYSQLGLVSWTGDSTNVMRIQDGFHKLNLAKDVSGYDTNIVFFSGNKLCAKEIGNTKFLIKLPDRIDTLAVHVEQQDSVLCIY